MVSLRTCGTSNAKNLLHVSLLHSGDTLFEFKRTVASFFNAGRTVSGSNSPRLGIVNTVLDVSHAAILAVHALNDRSDCASKRQLDSRTRDTRTKKIG